MGANSYLDFDLRFTREGDGYRAQILQSPGGVGNLAFSLPFQEHELENYLLKIGQRRAGMRGADSPETRAAREFGNRLYETVFQGPLANSLQKSMEAARTAERGLRIRLRLGETPELADLPWEYLYEAQRREFLALSKDTPVVRYFDLPNKVKPLAVTPPLRVLVMLSNPSDVDCLDVEKEWQKLKEAVRDLEERNLLIVDRLPHATLTDLLNCLRKVDCHVFHFIGHGSFNPATQESVLALENEKGSKRLISGDDLGIYLRDEEALRLVVLNACEGARASRTDPFSGAAQSLVLKGIPAVIAMQFEVSDEAAIAMASGFYSALADDYPVDAALTEARKAVFAAGCTVEWGTPVLYMRAEDGRIFDVNKTAAQKAEVRSEPAPQPAPEPPPLPTFETPRKPIAKPQPETVPVVTESAAPGKKRAPRRWVWMLGGVILTFAAFVALGIWMNSQEAKKKEGETKQVQLTPSPVQIINELPDGLKSEADTKQELNASKANDVEAVKTEIANLSKQQEEMNSKLQDYDQKARDAIANIRADSGSDEESPASSPALLTGQPAGNHFQPAGWWQLSTAQPLVVRRVEFFPNGRFSGMAMDLNMQTGPVSGAWSYDPVNSLFSVTFDDGGWFRVPLSVYNRGFAGFFWLNGGRVDLYLEPAQ